jgi:hypothetical protein
VVSHEIDQVKPGVMIIEINDDTTIRQINEKLSAYFPYVQAEFYIKLHKKYGTPGKKEDQAYPCTGNAAEKMGQTHMFDLLEIQPYYKVTEIERAFQQQFGLEARVFRKEMDVRKQITGTGDLTLKELNEMGRSFSEEYIIPENGTGLGQNQEE